ncbi:hypothetical protein PG995_006978 [Apiospora arundinis]
MADQGSGAGAGAGAGSNEWLLSNMVASNQQTDVIVTFACGHRHPIFRAAGGSEIHPPMDQVITDRLRRNRIVCHTCQYFAVVREVQEDTYVEVLRGMGDVESGQQLGPIPNNFDLLQMYYDMAQTFAQRVNQDQPTNVMDQCMSEFCRLIIVRLSPEQRQRGLANLLNLQVRHMQAGQSGGHVDIVRRLTEVLTADPMDLDRSTLGTSGGSTGRDPSSGSSPAGPLGSSPPGQMGSSPTDPAQQRPQVGFTQPVMGNGSSPSAFGTMLPGDPAPKPELGSDEEATSTWGDSPPPLRSPGSDSTEIPQRQNPTEITFHLDPPRTPPPGSYIGTPGRTQSTTPLGPPPKDKKLLSPIPEESSPGNTTSTTPQGSPSPSGNAQSTTPAGSPSGNVQSITPEGSPQKGNVQSTTPRGSPQGNTQSTTPQGQPEGLRPARPPVTPTNNPTADELNRLDGGHRVGQQDSSSDDDGIL